MVDELTAIVALDRLKGISKTIKREILLEVPSVASLFHGSEKTLNKEIHEKIRAFSSWKEIEKEIKRLNGMAVKVITLKDDVYPRLLRNIPDPPLVLYTKGPLVPGVETIGIVGSRKATITGMNLSEKVSSTLSSLGVTIVSGFARGIDTSAHKGALSEKGKTIAVLGCGIDICYPSENARLYRKITEEGLIITEYGLGEPPLRHHFPERNRIIAGLSKGVLVVEAARKSGALITAKLSIDYGREVMAIPGAIFRDEHKGTNAIIKEGARLVDGIEDIISTCFPTLKLKKKAEDPPLPIEEQTIFSLIGFDMIHVDEVIEESRMETRVVTAILTRLEIKDLIRQAPGGFYIRK